MPVQRDHPLLEVRVVAAQTESVQRVSSELTVPAFEHGGSGDHRLDPGLRLTDRLPLTTLLQLHVAYVPLAGPEIELAMEYGKPLILISPGGEWDEFASKAIVVKTIPQAVKRMEEWMREE